MADRQFVYTNEVPYETDVLNTNKYGYVGLGRLTDAVLGSTTQANGFNTVPLVIPALRVNVEQGEIYEQQVVDSTAYGELPTDDSLITKQGLLTETITLETDAPVGAGNSVDYLVQVSFSQIDTDITDRPYFNSADPSVPIFDEKSETRANIANVTAKVGIETTTGSQVPPAPDPGNVGLYIVTVAFGQTEVLAGDITVDPNSPLISADDKLKDKAGINKEQTWTKVQNLKSSDAQVDFVGILPMPSGILTKIPYSATPDFDSDNLWDSSNIRFNITRPGLYLLGIEASYSGVIPTPSSFFLEMIYQINGISSRIMMGSFLDIAGGTPSATVAGFSWGRFTVNDFIEYKVKQGSGANVDVTASKGFLTFMGN